MKLPALTIQNSLPAIIVSALPSYAAAQVDSPNPYDGNPQKSPQELLADLRDLHLPDEPHWWPPAPGWWLLLGLVSLLLFAVLSRVRRRSRGIAGRWQQSALDHHDRLQTELDQGATPNEVIAGSSVLMRKVALAVAPAGEVASVQHDAWLEILDKLGRTDQYSEGIGRLLLTHPYQKNSEVDQDQVWELLTLIRKTIHRAAEQTSA